MAFGVVASRQRQQVDLLAPDRRLHRGGRRFDDRCVSLDGHLFADAGDRQLEVDDRFRADRQRDAAPHGAAETLQLGRDLVGAGRHRRDAIATLLVGDAGADEAGFGVLGRDGGARQRRPLGVGDGADDGGSLLLRRDCGGDDTQNRGEGRQEGTSHQELLRETAFNRPGARTSSANLDMHGLLDTYRWVAITGWQCVSAHDFTAARIARPGRAAVSSPPSTTTWPAMTTNGIPADGMPAFS